MKKTGCDFLSCSMCGTGICWVTRGPRWGPKVSNMYNVTPVNLFEILRQNLINLFMKSRDTEIFPEAVGVGYLEEDVIQIVKIAIKLGRLNSVI